MHVPRNQPIRRTRVTTDSPKNAELIVDEELQNRPQTVRRRGAPDSGESGLRAVANMINSSKNLRGDLTRTEFFREYNRPSVELDSMDACKSDLKNVTD